MRPEITKKNRRRFIDIQPNALEWITAYRNTGESMVGPIVKLSVSRVQARRLRLRKSLGITNWPNSVMRNNFCSCQLAKFKDQNSLCLQSGHDSPDIKYNHYYKAITEKEAEKFWSIVPQGERENRCFPDCLIIRPSKRKFFYGPRFGASHPQGPGE
jgi:hypothetical protein